MGNKYSIYLVQDDRVNLLKANNSDLLSFKTLGEIEKFCSDNTEFHLELLGENDDFVAIVSDVKSFFQKHEENLSTIFHELNNPLASINASFTIMSRKLEKGNFESEGMLSIIKLAKNSIARISAYMKSVRAINKVHGYAIGSFNLQEKLATLLSEKYPQIELQAPDEHFFIKSYGDAFMNAFENLIDFISSSSQERKIEIIINTQEEIPYVLVRQHEVVLEEVEKKELFRRYHDETSEFGAKLYFAGEYFRLCDCNISVESSNNITEYKIECRNEIGVQYVSCIGM